MNFITSLTRETVGRLVAIVFLSGFLGIGAYMIYKEYIEDKTTESSVDGNITTTQGATTVPTPTQGATTVPASTQGASTVPAPTVPLPQSCISEFDGTGNMSMDCQICAFVGGPCTSLMQEVQTSNDPLGSMYDAMKCICDSCPSCVGDTDSLISPGLCTKIHATTREQNTAVCDGV